MAVYILVALSRLVLGLHYPSDVLAGAAIGTLRELDHVGVMGMSRRSVNIAIISDCHLALHSAAPTGCCII